jgi:hypothetical protein
MTLAMPLMVLAHPGHVHHPAPVHGYSWIDLLGLLAIVVVPLALARRTTGRGHGRDR